MIKYNDYTFPDYTSITAEISMVYDEADRKVVGHKYVLNIVTIIAPDSPGQTTIDVAMNEVLSKINQPGKALELKDHGFGADIDINRAPNAAWDIDSGPKPRVIGWKPIGGNISAELTYSLEFTIVPCPTEDNPLQGIKELNYGIQFTMNGKGFTTRTVTGYLTVIQRTIAGAANPIPSDSADRFRDKFVVVALYNFQRTHQSYQTSPDKSRLDFTLVDTEIESPNAYPVGVVSINAPMRTRVKFPNPKSNKAENSLTVRMELQSTTPRVRAWEIFQAMFSHRIQGIIADDKYPVIQDMFISEDPFTHRYEFAIQFLAIVPFNKLIKGLGFFSALTREDWERWSTSMTTAQSQRGYANLQHAYSSTDDSLVNYCDNGGPDPAVLSIDHTHAIAQPAPPSFAAICNDTPPEEKSYTQFDSYLTEAPQTESYQETTYGDVTLGELNTDWSKYGNQEPYYKPDDAASNYTTSITQAPPRQRYIWSGMATRIGYEIPPLHIPKIGGKDTAVVGSPRHMHRRIGTMFCLPIYQRVWSVGLAVIEAPGPIEPTDPTGTTTQDEEPS